MRLEWLRQLYAGCGPYATVLMDATHDTENAAARERLRWRGLRAELADQGAPDDVLAQLDQAVQDAAIPVGDGGRVLVADTGGVLFDRLTPTPPAVPTARCGALPDLLAVAVAMPDAVRTVVVHVDETGGRVAVAGGEGRSVGGEGPVHKVPAGGPSHLSMQERVEERWRRNTAAVAAAADEEIRKIGADLLVVSGDARSRSRLRDALSARSVELMTEVEHTGGAEPELGDTVERAADDVRERRNRAAIARFAQAYGRAEGLAVTGLADVVAASRAQAVETLLVDTGALPGTELFVGAEPEAVAIRQEDLATLGAAPIGHAAAGSALLRAAAATAADLVLTRAEAAAVRDPLDPDAVQPERSAPADSPDYVVFRRKPPPLLVDGIGAILRFPIG
jgi:hypothetical protein